MAVPTNGIELTAWCVFQLATADVGEELLGVLGTPVIFLCISVLNVLFLQARIYAMRNFAEVVRHDEAKQLPQSKLVQFISDDDLSVSNENVVLQVKQSQTKAERIEFVLFVCFTLFLFLFFFRFKENIAKHPGGRILETEKKTTRTGEPNHVGSCNLRLFWGGKCSFFFLFFKRAA